MGVSLPLLVLVYGVFVVLLLRYGIVPLVVAFSRRISAAAPLTLDSPPGMSSNPCWRCWWSWGLQSTASQSTWRASGCLIWSSPKSVRRSSHGNATRGTGMGRVLT